MLTIIAVIAGVVAVIVGLNALVRGEVQFSPKTRLLGRSARIAGLVSILAGALIMAAAIGLEFYGRPGR